MEIWRRVVIWGKSNVEKLWGNLGRNTSNQLVFILELLTLPRCMLCISISQWEPRIQTLKANSFACGIHHWALGMRTPEFNKGKKVCLSFGR